jgi:hypothetical protein
MKTMERSSAFGGYLWRVFLFLLPRSLACAQVDLGYESQPSGDHEARRRIVSILSAPRSPVGAWANWSKRRGGGGLYAVIRDIDIHPAMGSARTWGWGIRRTCMTLPGPDRNVPDSERPAGMQSSWEGRKRRTKRRAGRRT